MAKRNYSRLKKASDSLKFFEDCDEFLRTLFYHTEKLQGFSGKKVSMQNEITPRLSIVRDAANILLSKVSDYTYIETYEY